MAEIKLGNKNIYTLIDTEDFMYLNQKRWRLSTQGYAITGKKKIISMHRLLNQTPEGFDTDHINRNKLDNRKVNLRTVSKIENGRNRDNPKHNTSGFKGVAWDKSKNRWLASLRVNYKHIFLGRFKKIEDAIQARKYGEEKYWI